MRCATHCPKPWFPAGAEAGGPRPEGTREKKNKRPKPKSIVGYQWRASLEARGGWDSNARA
jgi:hypothetical protein